MFEFLFDGKKKILNLPKLKFMKNIIQFINVIIINLLTQINIFLEHKSTIIRGKLN